MKFFKKNLEKETSWNRRYIFAFSGAESTSGENLSDKEKEEHRQEVNRARKNTKKERHSLSKSIKKINKDDRLKGKLIETETRLEKHKRVNRKRKTIQKIMFGEKNEEGGAAGGSEFFQKLPQRLKDKILRWRGQEVEYDSNEGEEYKERKGENYKSVLAEVQSMSLNERKLLFAPRIGGGKRMFMLYGIRALENLSIQKLFPEMSKVTFGKGKTTVASDYYTKGNSGTLKNKMGVVLSIGTGSVFREGHVTVSDRGFQNLRNMINIGNENTESFVDERRDISTEDLLKLLENKGKHEQQEQQDSQIEANFRIESEDDKSYSVGIIKNLYNKDPQRFRNLFIKGEIGGSITINFLGIPALEKYITLGMVLPNSMKKIKVDGNTADRTIIGGNLEYIYSDGDKKGQRVKIFHGMKIDTSIKEEGKIKNTGKAELKEETEAIEGYLKRMETQSGRELRREKDRVNKIISILKLKPELTKRNEFILKEIRKNLIYSPFDGYEGKSPTLDASYDFIRNGSEMAIINMLKDSSPKKRTYIKKILKEYRKNRKYLLETNEVLEKGEEKRAEYALEDLDIINAKLGSGVDKKKGIKSIEKMNPTELSSLLSKLARKEINLDKINTGWDILGSNKEGKRETSGNEKIKEILTKIVREHPRVIQMFVAEPGNREEALALFTDDLGGGWLKFKSYGIKGLEQYVSLAHLVGGGAIEIEGSAKTTSIGFARVNSGNLVFEGVERKGLKGSWNSIVRSGKNKWNAFWDLKKGKKGEERSKPLTADGKLHLGKDTVFRVLKPGEINQYLSKENQEKAQISINDAAKANEYMMRERATIAYRANHIATDQVKFNKYYKKLKGEIPKGAYQSLGIEVRQRNLIETYEERVRYIRYFSGNMKKEDREKELKDAYEKYKREKHENRIKLHKKLFGHGHTIKIQDSKFAEEFSKKIGIKYEETEKIHMDYRLNIGDKRISVATSRIKDDLSAGLESGRYLLLTKEKVDFIMQKVKAFPQVVKSGKGIEGAKKGISEYLISIGGDAEVLMKYLEEIRMAEKMKNEAKTSALATDSQLIADATRNKPGHSKVQENGGVHGKTRDILVGQPELENRLKIRNLARNTLAEQNKSIVNYGRVIGQVSSDIKNPDYKRVLNEVAKKGWRKNQDGTYDLADVNLVSNGDSKSLIKNLSTKLKNNNFNFKKYSPTDTSLVEKEDLLIKSFLSREPMTKEQSKTLLRKFNEVRKHRSLQEYKNHTDSQNKNSENKFTEISNFSRISEQKLNNIPEFSSLNVTSQNNVRKSLSSERPKGVEPIGFTNNGEVIYLVPGGGGEDVKVKDTSKKPKGKIPLGLSDPISDAMYSDNFRTPQILAAIDDGNMLRDMKMLQINTRNKRTSMTDFDDLIKTIYPRRTNLFGPQIIKGWTNFSRYLSSENNKTGIEMTDIFQYYQDKSDGSLDYNVKSMNENAMGNIRGDFQEFILKAKSSQDFTVNKLKEISIWKERKKELDEKDGL